MKPLFSDDEKKHMIEQIKQYFYDERDIELGDLAASFTLDFFVEILEPKIYNKGIQDAQEYLNDKILDLDALKKYGR